MKMSRSREIEAHLRLPTPYKIMEFTFNKEKHYYTLDDKRLYGITNVLSVIAKPALIQWAANEAVKYIDENWGEFYNEEFTVGDSGLHFDPEALTRILKEAKTAHRRKKEDAADKGTDIHAKLEAIIKKAIDGDGYIKQKTSKEPQIQKFLEWAEGKKFLHSEKQMYSQEHWIAGTCDMIFEVDGKTYVGDIKTTSGIYDRTPFFQTAGYAIMLNESMGIMVEGSCIVRIGKDGSFEEKWSYDVEGDKKGFLAALTLFKELETFKTN